MFFPCQNPFGHQNQMLACRQCEALICSTCNLGDQCGGGCEAFEAMDVSEEDSHDILIFDEDNDEIHDSVVVDDEYLFGYIRDIEREDSKQVPYVHVIFECIDQQWFAQLNDDLSDMPPWNTVAQESMFCIVDLTVTLDVLLEIVTAVDAGEQYFYPGNWIEMVVNRDQDPRDNRPKAAIDIFLPPEGVTNPASTGLTGIVDSRWFMRSIARVPDQVWGLRKLRRLSQVWVEE